MNSDNANSFLSPKSEQTRQRPKGRFLPNPKASLREQLHEVCRFLHYSDRTENSYWQWIVRFLRFHRVPTPNPSKEGNGRGWRHPRDLGAGEVAAFLSNLATEQKLAAATQNQAFHPVR